MNHTIVIAGRELRERYRIFLMAAGLAVLPFLATLLPAAKDNKTELISALSAFLAMAMAFGVSAAHGASTIAGDLAERRLSYYFSKPISASALWFGKTLAALLASYVCFAIIAGPALLVLRTQWWNQWQGGMKLLGFVAIGVLLLYLVSHVLSTMVRSKSALVAIDFVLAAVLAAAVYSLLRPVVMGGAAAVAKGLILALSIAFLLILAIAPVWQLAQGRTDIRRSHAALSRFLWVAIGAVLLASAAYVGWLVSVDPDDLDALVDLEQAPAGNAVAIVGMSPGRGDYMGSFLLDRSNGEYTRLSSPPWWGGVRYSRDGRVTVWSQPTSILKPHAAQELYVRRANGKIEPAGIEGSGGFEFVLSDDGSRVATMQAGKLIVQDLAAKRLLTVVPLDRAHDRSFWFVTPDLVRVMVRHGQSRNIHIYELNVAARKLTKTGEIEHHEDDRATSSGDGTRVYLARSGIIADGRTGAKIATLPIVAPNRLSGSMLNDGTIAVVKREGDGTVLHTFSRDGQARHTIALPTTRTWIAGTVGDTKLLLAGHRGQVGKPSHNAMFVIDLERGVLERTVDGIRGPGPYWSTDPRAQRFAVGQRLVATDGDDKLLLWDPKTGAQSPFPRS